MHTAVLKVRAGPYDVDLDLVCVAMCCRCGVAGVPPARPPARAL